MSWSHLCTHTPSPGLRSARHTSLAAGKLVVPWVSHGKLVLSWDLCENHTLTLHGTSLQLVRGCASNTCCGNSRSLCQLLRSPDPSWSDPTCQCRHRCCHRHLHITFRCSLLVCLEAGDSDFPVLRHLFNPRHMPATPWLLGHEECKVRGRLSIPPPLQNSLLSVFWKSGAYNIFLPFSSWRNKVSPSAQPHHLQQVRISLSEENASRFHFFP